MLYDIRPLGGVRGKKEEGGGARRCAFKTRILKKKEGGGEGRSPSRSSFSYLPQIFNVGKRKGEREKGAEGEIGAAFDSRRGRGQCGSPLRHRSKRSLMRGEKKKGKEGGKPATYGLDSSEREEGRGGHLVSLRAGGGGGEEKKKIKKLVREHNSEGRGGMIRAFTGSLSYPPLLPSDESH